MPDVQILAPGDENAPLPYVVLGSQRIIPKALFATFDGSGAGGSFLPCIRILSPAGEVVGEYVTDEAVAAGSSADVSFAPFLRGAQSSAAAAASYAIFDAFSQTVVGTTATMRWGLTSDHRRGELQRGRGRRQTHPCCDHRVLPSRCQRGHWLFSAGGRRRTPQGQGERQHEHLASGDLSNEGHDRSRLPGHHYAARPSRLCR
jgi:hypothetical protein